jgi:3-phenylpropionate/trans-cinnamate dioxygenase ferredoxin component
MTQTAEWTYVASSDDLEDEDVLQVEIDGRTLAVYYTNGEYFATDGICSHELAYLADGFVFGSIIECPKHQGRFDIRTGQPKGAPACVPIRTYPARAIEGEIHVQLHSDGGR